MKITMSQMQDVIMRLPHPAQYDWRKKGTPLDVVVQVVKEGIIAEVTTDLSTKTPFHIVDDVITLRFRLNVNDRAVPFWEATEEITIVPSKQRVW